MPNLDPLESARRLAAAITDETTDPRTRGKAAALLGNLAMLETQRAELRSELEHVRNRDARGRELARDLLAERTPPRPAGLALEITTGNAAMQTPEDVAGALRDVAERLERGRSAGPVVDENGNTVGRFALELEPADPHDSEGS